MGRRGPREWVMDGDACERERALLLDGVWVVAVRAVSGAVCGDTVLVCVVGSRSSFLSRSGSQNLEKRTTRITLVIFCTRSRA